MVDIETTKTISEIIGWIYFSTWSLSFYGQIYENFKLKSVKGVSWDYLLLNLFGFTGYSIYNIWYYIDKDYGVSIEIQDVLFAVHALACSIITVFQILIYYDKSDPKQRFTSLSINISICLTWGLILILILEQGLGLYDPKIKKNQFFNLNSLSYLGWCKAFISLVKYIPQVILNYKRKSTVGWSLFNIFLDFTGGFFSFTQNFIDTVFIGKGLGLNDSLNIVKYAISVISMFFDVIFLVQHYVLYRNNGQSDGQSDYEKERADAEKALNAYYITDDNRLVSDMTN